MYRFHNGKGIYSLQLGLALGLLEDGLHLGRLHDVTLDLELATHEQTLSVGLAGDELLEVLVGEGESDYSGVSRRSEYVTIHYRLI